jgi:hypothetical protein
MPLKGFIPKKVLKDAKIMFNHLFVAAAEEGVDIYSIDRSKNELTLLKNLN